jgi:hypothetical protein
MAETPEASDYTSVQARCCARQRPTGRRTTVEQHHDATAAKRLADPHDDRSRPKRAGFVLSQQVR